MLVLARVPLVKSTNFEVSDRISPNVFVECFRRPRTLRAERRVALLRFARKQGWVQGLMRLTLSLRSYTQFVELPFHSGFVGRSPATLEKRIHIDSVRPI